MNKKIALLLVVVLALGIMVTGCKDKKYGAYRTIQITEETYVEMATQIITLYRDGQITEQEYNQLKMMGKRVEIAINTAKLALRMYISFEDDRHYQEMILAVDDMIRLFDDFRTQFAAKGGGK